MLASFIAVKAHCNSKEDKIFINRNLKTPQKKQKIFLSPRTNYQAQTITQNFLQKSRKWNSLSQKQKYEPLKQKYQKTRKAKSKQQLCQQSDIKKNNQIMIRQTLRKTLNNRLENYSSLSGKSIKWFRNSGRMIDNKSQHFKQKEDLFDDFHELEGVKCIINTPSKTKNNHQNQDQKKYRNKSTQHKEKHQQKVFLDLTELSINQDQPFNESIIAIGMAAKKHAATNSFQAENQKKFMTSSNNNKIAISTSQCVVFAQPNVKKISLNPGLIIESQSNFIRVHKKSKALSKKVINIQKYETEHEKIDQSKIFRFKNNLNRNLNLEINNSKNTKLTKLTKQVKKQQNMKISGWEMQIGQDIQANF